ncbi:tetratricopeptide repeat protein [Cereibacter sphaeroides]|uniref:tetratricopeptide repeat protein n=1 Tax=Cereibacter sphaeroides TaxID=1063 RepID=UPI001F3F8879|nr:tetratricopeptide repeat protein [Cereibacter sphaeroides]MCE6950286.1 tetratricopeptide repeat protein [Cereibacter sphaeroides]
MRPFLPLILVAALGLSACESSEEKAERYYRSGLELLEAGDEQRAIVEFRNVFRYNPAHREARRAFADLLMKQGHKGDAYAQYLKLIEQDPNILPVRTILAELALGASDWDEAERHGRAALALVSGPLPTGLRAIRVSLDYHAALAPRDEAALARLGEEARAILAEAPDNMLARRLLIDRLMTGGHPAEALAEVEIAVAADPKDYTLQALKHDLLSESGNAEAAGAQLRRMFELFPERQEVQAALIGWYMSRKDLEAAEGLLRTLAGGPGADPAGHITLVRFLQTTKGTEAAIAELRRLVETNRDNPSAALYAALEETLRFDQGDREKAMAGMQAILEGSESSDQTRRIKAMFASMKLASGDPAGSRALAEEILAEDPRQVDALKLRARMLIDEDRPGAAILDLRTALDQAPRDAEIATLTALAHERDGNLELAGEQLSRAVEISGRAPAESLSYARFLVRQGRDAAAEAVLTDARRSSPAHLELLLQLAELRLKNRNWVGAQEVANTLRAIDSPEAQRTARELQAALLLGQDRVEEGLDLLQSQAEGVSEHLRAAGLIVQAQVRSGRIAEARTYLDGMLARTPDDRALLLLSGNLHAVAGEFAPAEAIFRDLIARDPADETPVRLLYQLLVTGGRAEEAVAVIEAGVQAAPKSALLRWILAGHREQAGDIDGAIAIYEALYAEDSFNVVVANNLASLISARRDDPGSLERAQAISRRLKGSNTPAFQDTYGWIEYRRGNILEALSHLEPAAAGLPTDPLVQFHLGMTYASLKRPEDAARQLRRALELAEGKNLPQMQEAQRVLADLQRGTATGVSPAPASP